MASINNAYEESLSNDRKKVEEDKRLHELMQARLERVPPQADLSEPHCPISIRHPVLDRTKSYIFKTPCCFQQVYDWVGSLSIQPEHFEIRDYKGKFMQPYEEIKSGTYNMVVVENAVLMSPSGTVSFKGFSSVQNHTESAPERESPVPPSERESHVPPSETQVKDVSIEMFRLLQDLQGIAYERLTEMIYVVVSRDNIYDDMKSLYQKRNTILHKISISFKGENATGNGVSRDAYSAYFDEVYARMDGFSEKVPSQRFDDEDAEIFGKILTHAFVCFDIFPVGLSKSALNIALRNDVSDEELLGSFMQFIQPKEADIVNRFIKGVFEEKDCQAISDILFEYSIFTKPKQDNVLDLMKKAAKVALINSPCYLMQKISEGMGSFWNKVTNDMLDALYSCTLPTAENILENVIANETCPQDQKVCTWFHRYVRGCNKEELQMLMRFISGSTSLQPYMKIRIEFIDQIACHLRPCSKTCFKILLLARQYSSFTEMKENLKFYIGNSHNWSVHDDIFSSDYAF